MTDVITNNKNRLKVLQDTHNSCIHMIENLLDSNLTDEDKFELLDEIQNKSLLFNQMCHSTWIDYGGNDTELEISDEK